MQRFLGRAAGALLATTLLVAACGDDDSDTPSADPAAGADDGTGDGTGGHAHGEGIEVEGPAPTVEIEATPDSVGGLNLHVETTNFTFAPEHASTDHVEGEGHAHIYVDGEKVGRLYGTDHYLGDVEAGEHEITVDLNANDHSPLLVDGEPVATTITVDVPETDHGAHDHGSDGVEAAAPAPTVTLTVEPDAKAGFNVQVETENFTFAPAAVGGDAVDGEGHAHLYVDGVKITRLYGEWYHLDIPLLAGEHEVTVDLNANDHTPLLADGDKIEASATITVDEADASDDAGHDAGHDGSDTSHDDHGDGSDTDGDDHAGEAGTEGQVIEIDVAEGAVDGGGRIAVPLGETVTILVTSDVADHIHVHGYDLFADVEAGGTGSITFEATIPGVFEVELEDSAIELVELEIS